MTDHEVVKVRIIVDEDGDPSFLDHTGIEDDGHNDGEPWTSTISADQHADYLTCIRKMDEIMRAAIEASDYEYDLEPWQGLAT